MCVYYKYGVRYYYNANDVHTQYIYSNPASQKTSANLCNNIYCIKHDNNMFVQERNRVFLLLAAKLYAFSVDFVKKKKNTWYTIQRYIIIITLKRIYYYVVLLHLVYVMRIVPSLYQYCGVSSVDDVLHQFRKMSQRSKNDIPTWTTSMLIVAVIR